MWILVGMESKINEAGRLTLQFSNVHLNKVQSKALYTVTNQLPLSCEKSRKWHRRGQISHYVSEQKHRCCWRGYRWCCSIDRLIISTWPPLAPPFALLPGSFGNSWAKHSNKLMVATRWWRMYTGTAQHTLSCCYLAELIDPPCKLEARPWI